MKFLKENLRHSLGLACFIIIVICSMSVVVAQAPQKEGRPEDKIEKNKFGNKVDSLQFREGISDAKELLILCLNALPDEESSNLYKYRISMSRGRLYNNWLVAFDKIPETQYRQVGDGSFDIVYNIESGRAMFMRRP